MAGRPPLPVGTFGNIRRQELADGRWLAEARFRDRDGVSRRVKATGSTGARAEAALRERLKDRSAQGGSDVLTPESPVSALLERWLASVDASDRAAATKTYYRDCVEQVVAPGVGALRIRELDPQCIDGFLRGLDARGRDARTVLSQACRMGVQWGLFPYNPVTDAYSPPRPKALPRALTPEDVEALLNRIATWQGDQKTGPRRGFDLNELFTMLLATGTRIGELLALRWVDVANLDDPTVPVTVTVGGTLNKTGERQPWTKTASGFRTVTLHEFGREALLRQRDRGFPFDLIFPSRTGKPRAAGNVRTLWRQIRGEDYAWVTPHTFRRTVATMVERGFTTDAAAKQLGHSDPSVTRRHYIERAAAAPDVASALDSMAAAVRRPARHLRPINDL
jgi:integrase